MRRTRARHVGSFALIVSTVLQSYRYAAANGGDGMRGVELECRRRLLQSSGCLRPQRSVAVQIENGCARIGRGPLLRFAPRTAVIQATGRVFVTVTRTHQKVFYRRLLRHCGMHGLQMVVEPSYGEIRIEIGDRCAT